MKKIGFLLLMDLIYIMVLLYYYMASIEYYSGGCCDYWRCIEGNMSIFNILMMMLPLQFLITAMITLKEDEKDDG